jgi:hypothetical protein
MTSYTETTDTFPYPTGSVVGVLTDDTALDNARRRLGAAGFEADRYDVLQGEEGLARIDVEGAAHGALGALKRRVQAALSDDAEHARRYVDHLRAGRYVVGVRVGEEEAAKERAVEALRGSPAEFVHYYGENYVEDLDT